MGEATAAGAAMAVVSVVVSAWANAVPLAQQLKATIRAVAVFLMEANAIFCMLSLDWLRWIEVRTRQSTQWQTITDSVENHMSIVHAKRKKPLKG